LNRVDDIIVFHPLTRQDLEQIIDIELGEVKDRLKEKKMELLLSDEVLKFLIDQGYDPVFGARPLKRTIQRHIENILAEEILGGKFREGDKIRAEVRGDRIVFEKAT
jgi:ATP-dependent Clp protease ATP-binding subunit ClpA